MGYGCTTCIGNSGPLPEPIANAVTKGNLVVAAVLSGNRNFEGRINPHVKANYLASPPLVVAYAMAGTTDIDLNDRAARQGRRRQGRVPAGHLADAERNRRHDRRLDVARNVQAGIRHRRRSAPRSGRAISSRQGELYDWDPEQHLRAGAAVLRRHAGEACAHLSRFTGRACWCRVGDSVTTDHISPAGSIKADSPAGQYLQANGVKPLDFNSYGSRRGNDRVMTRGTFANIRLKNLLCPGTEGGVTKYLPTGEQMSIYDAADEVQGEQELRSSCWPARNTAPARRATGPPRERILLGIRAVIAVSYERIHRSNLVGMGVLPLEYRAR